MKKLIAVAVILLSSASVSFAGDSSWVKLSLFDQIAYPNVKTVKGADLGLIYSNTPAVRGLQYNFIYAKTEDIEGVQLAFVNSADSAAGLQYGCVNLTKDMKGVQLGFVNVADKFSGFQFALVNYTKVMEKGLQIGLVNVIKNSKLPIMVVANARL
ncbi:MAG TPA: hypothetical protein PLL10_00550 [Elusimicrobiales bacterium]|nr:hypothetical protein [Elusimicrobiales bacterium]